MRHERSSSYTTFKLPATISKLKSDLDQKRADEIAKLTAWMVAKSRKEKLDRLLERCKLVAPATACVVHANDTKYRNKPQHRQRRDGSGAANHLQGPRREESDARGLHMCPPGALDMSSVERSADQGRGRRRCRPRRTGDGVLRRFLTR